MKKKLNYYFVLTIIFLIGFKLNIFAGVIVNSSTAHNLDVEVTLPEIQFIEQAMQDGNTYTTVLVDESGELEVGKPDVPVFGNWILIPNGTSAHVSVSRGNPIIYKNINLAPLQPSPYDSEDLPKPAFQKDENVYSRNENYPGIFAKTEAAKKKREQQCTILWIYPYQYNPVQKTLSVYPDLHVTVHFSGSIQPIPVNVWNDKLEKSLRSMAINAKEVLSAEIRAQKTDIKNESRIEGYEMLIITALDFEDAAENLAMWKKRKGITCKVVTTDITGISVNSIETYIDNEYYTCNPAPSYLLFVGDVEFIPTWYVDDDPATDIYYADVNNPVDLVTEFSYGRLSVDTAAQADSLVARIIRYEKTPPTENSYYSDATFISIFQDGSWHWEVNAQGDSIRVDDPPDGFANRRFSHTSEDVREFLDDSEGYNTERIYRTSNHCWNDNTGDIFPTNWTTAYWAIFENDSAGGGDSIAADLLKPGFPWNGNGADMSTAFNNGTFLSLYRAHGNRGGWFNFGINNVNNLNNGEKRPIIWSPTCQTGWFDHETDGETETTTECFAETWLRHNTGGSVGILAASRNSSSGQNDRLVWGLTDAIWPDFTTTCNDPYGTDDSFFRLGDVMHYGMDYMSTKYTFGARKNTLKLFHWFGDPTMEIWTQVPNTLTNVEVTSNIELGTSQVTVQVTPSLPDFTVTFMSYENDIYGSATTNESGNATISLNESISEEVLYYVTVSKVKYEPYTLKAGWFPDLWTGELSQLWNIDGNWENGIAPTSTDDVVIPSGCTNYPAITYVDAECKNLEIENGASLTIHGKTLEVQEDVNIYGELIMDNDDAELIVYDDLYWRSGSTADIPADGADIIVYDVFEFYNGSNAHLDKGTVFMQGSANTQISGYDTSYLNNLYINKSGFATVIIGGEFSGDLVVKGTFTIGSNSIVNDIYEGRDLILHGNFDSYGFFQFDVANVEFSGDTQYVNMNSGDYFDDMIINSPAIVTLSDNLTINGDLHLNYGNLTSNDYDISIKGDWQNDTGSLLGFFPGAGEVVFNGTEDQYCYEEQFNELHLNKSSGELIIPNGANVSCTGYEWTQGILTVDGGTFTTDDILDTTIKGTYQLIDGQIDLHQDATYYPDVNGSIIIYDGVFNIHGGGDECYFASANDAYLYMSGGVLDVKDWGIHIDDNNQFSHVITGGTIKMNGSFSSDRHDFSPTGGYVHLYGSEDAEIDFGWGNEFHHLVINKQVSKEFVKKEQRSSKRRPMSTRRNTRSGILTLNQDLIVTHNMEITNGQFDLNGNSVEIGGSLAIYGLLKMIDANDLLEVGSDIVWRPGSTENITAGEITIGKDWYFKEGTNASLGIGNTVRFDSSGTSQITISEFDNCSFGNVVIDKLSGKVEQNTSYAAPLEIDGDLTINDYDTLNVYRGVVNGELFMGTGSEFNFEGITFKVASDVTCGGNMNILAGDFTGNSDFSLSGEMTIDGGNCILDRPYTGNFMSFAGTLNLLDGNLEITNDGIQFGAGATTNITDGFIKVGGHFRANQPNAFQPAGGTVEFIGTGYSSIDCGNGNYFHNLEIDKLYSTYSCYLSDSLLVNNDLTMETGKLEAGSYQIIVNNNVNILTGGVLDPDNKLLKVGNNWTNNRGTAGFVEGTGTVELFGSFTGQITTDETFYNLKINKTIGDYYYTEITESNNVHIENNLHIDDGKVLLKDNVTLDIDGDLVLQDNTALRVYDDAIGVEIKTAKNWHDYNSTSNNYFSFIPGTSKVTLDGDSMQVLYINRYNYEFNDLDIDKSDSDFIPYTDVIINGDLAIANGRWYNPWSDMNHYFQGNVSLCTGGWFDNMGTVTFRGSEDATFEKGDSNNVFHHVNISKTDARDKNSKTTGTVTLLSDLICQSNGNLYINDGSLDTNGYDIICDGNLYVYSDKLSLNNGSQLTMGEYQGIYVYNSGVLELLGLTDNQVNVKNENSLSYHDFNIESGGTIRAENTIFENSGYNGVNIKAGAIVGADSNDVFRNCTFTNGSSGGYLLTVNNSQNLEIHNAIFPTNTWGSYNNVSKTVNSGNVDFIAASGGFSGEAYDEDYYNRIDWLSGPEITLYPDTLNFGNLTPGVSDTMWMNIYNSGDITLTGSITTPAGFTISEMVWKRDDNITQKVSIKPKANIRNVLDFEIPAGNMLDYDVIFQPTALQDYTNEMVITHNAGADTSVTLIGQGFGAEIEANPLNFDPVLAENGSVSENLNISNLGNDSLRYFSYFDYGDKERTAIIEEGFEGTQFPPIGWSEEAAGTDTITWVQSYLSPHSGDKHALTNMDATDTRLITPFFTATANTYLSCWIKTNEMMIKNNAKFGIEVTTNGSDWTMIYQISKNSLSKYYQKVLLDLTAYASQNIKISFRAFNNDTMMDEFYLDDIFIGGDTPAQTWLKLDGEISVYDEIEPSGSNHDITVDVDAADLTEGSYAADIWLISNCYVTPQISIPVNLTVGSPYVEVTPNTLDFGKVATDTYATLNFDIDNLAASTLTGTISTPTGFEVSEILGKKVNKNPARAKNTLPIEIEAVSTGTFQIIFNPQLVQPYSGDVTITYNLPGTDEIITVSGTGITYPAVSTDTLSNIAYTTANCGGNVTSDGGSSITARGVCWSTETNPTIGDEITEDGDGTGVFTSSISGLTADTHYYIRAYATNSAGTEYGEEREFDTLPYLPPSIPTNLTIQITETDIVLNWDEVTGADSYKIYSSDDPNKAKETWDFEAEITETTWSENIPDTKKFYYVKSVKTYEKYYEVKK